MKVATSIGLVQDKHLFLAPPNPAGLTRVGESSTTLYHTQLGCRFRVALRAESLEQLEALEEYALGLVLRATLLVLDVIQMSKLAGSLSKIGS